MADLAESYVCNLCGRIFPKEISDEEARTEYEHRFKEEVVAGTAIAVVCDDCYGWMFDATGRLRSEHFGQQPPWTI